MQRDLHDGAQQRLLALRVRLELAGDTPVDPETLRAFAREIDVAVNEVRAFAHGVSPPLLSSHGLVDALRSAARGVPLPIRIHGSAIGRYPPEIERAAYFCCLEAIHNASKHAQGATEVCVTLVDDGKLRLEVRDNGDGFDVAATPGVGLVNMRDRVASVGGELDLRSTPHDGTMVAVALPQAGS
jgi:signal transduction histidine kinase